MSPSWYWVSLTLDISCHKSAWKALSNRKKFLAMVVLLIEKSFFAVLWYRRPTVSKSPGARFSKSPETFRAHNSLCIFKTKVSRGTKRCSYFDFSQFPLQHVKRPGLHNKRVGVSGPKSFRDFGENGPLDKRHFFSLPCPTPYISLPLPSLFSYSGNADENLFDMIFISTESV